ncbi:hypothetical protein BDY21DRAFT_277086 [Lineolata rhizophorae]|uniref:Nudix hydrolase domain-containing protein n=1 Tax=Lineolata rhizophorae TaxID=578093 RepID=A0A6A6PF21_9PEZI|nr:hypothetical protein BDY21DRAFT_277086 [Lineolata rhizophorae]
MSTETSSADSQDPPAPSALVPDLHRILVDLSQHPFPAIPNPPACTKRASVALIIRINPRYAHWPPPRRPAAGSNNNGGSCNGPSSTDASYADITASAALPPDASVADRLGAFFTRDWAAHGDPEILFIKRAARVGDPWTSHVALPGGRRDPDDEDDKAAAVREADEEVGVRLDDSNAIAVGNLAQRVVTANWGKMPIMVLCPYVFLLTTHDMPPLRLQPSEVASAHWVPLRALLSPATRTIYPQDMAGSRLAKAQGGYLKAFFMQTMLRTMLFAAIRLIPSESFFCSTIPGFIPSTPSPPSVCSRLSSLVRPSAGATLPDSPSTDKPLLLWGLTLGIVSDLLELLPPYSALDMVVCPSFSPPDVRLLLRLATARFRAEHARRVRGDNQAAIAFAGGLDSVELPRPLPLSDERRRLLEHPPGSGSLGAGAYEGKVRRHMQGRRTEALDLMLQGYYKLLKRVVVVAFIGRVAMVAAVVVGGLRWWRRR